MILKNQKGWVYIDALIGMTILALAITALALNFHQSTQGTLSISNQTQATYLAHQLLTELKIYDHTGLDRSSPQWFKSDFFDDPNSKTKFQYTTKVLDPDEIPDGLDVNVIPVRVTVQWSEPTGDKVLQIVTYYYK